MQALNDEKSFEWIRDGRGLRISPIKNRTSPDWPGMLVSHLIPPVFERYVKILNRIDASFGLIDRPLSPEENAVLKIPSCEPLKSFVEQRRAAGKVTRIRWRELAELLNVPLAPEICVEWFRTKLEDAWCWSRLLSGAGDEALKEEQAEVVSQLAACAGMEECFFRFSDIPFYSSPTNEKMPRLFKGGLDEVRNLPASGPYFCRPEYWWPSSRSWCVCSEYDLAVTIVGGSGALVSSFLESNVLECLQVTAQTCVDRFVPFPA